MRQCRRRFQTKRQPDPEERSRAQPGGREKLPASSAANEPTYALLFADRLPAHFRRCGVELSRLTVQTDNGSQLGGHWNRRHGLPAFTRLVEQKSGCRAHRFSPPHRSTYNSAAEAVHAESPNPHSSSKLGSTYNRDVEAVHGLMEREFYELERFAGSVRGFLSQACSYQFRRAGTNSGSASCVGTRTRHAPRRNSSAWRGPQR